MPELNDKKPSKASRPPYIQVLMRAGAIGTNFAYAVIGGGVLGWVIDYFAKTSPLWTLIGLGLGLVGGMYRFIRDAMRELKRPSNMSEK